MGNIILLLSNILLTKNYIFIIMIISEYLNLIACLTPNINNNDD